MASSFLARLGQLSRSLERSLAANGGVVGSSATHSTAESFPGATGYFEQTLRTLSTPPSLLSLRVFGDDTDAVVHHLVHTVGVPPHAVQVCPWAARGGVQLLTIPAAFRDAVTHGMAATFDDRVAVQSRPSVAAALALQCATVRNQSTVLDMCAAPGSKTGAVAQAMGYAGRIVANEKSKPRFHKLQATLRRQGLIAADYGMFRDYSDDDRGGDETSGGGAVTARYPRLVVTPTMGDGITLCHRYSQSFNRVLCDVPCSGEGRVFLTTPGADEQPGAAPELPSHSQLKRLPGDQKALLHSAFECCVPGGVVVYSTCTLNIDENEGVVSHALKRYAGRVRLASVDDLLGADAVADLGILPGVTVIDDSAQGRTKPRYLQPELALCGRMLPQQGEGFFIAVFDVV